MKISQRVRSAVNLILKGSIAPFDRLIDLGGVSASEKLSSPYKQSLWVARAIKHVAEPCTTVPLKFGTERRGDSLEIPALSEFWEEPAQGPAGAICWREAVMATIGWLKLAGECFWVLDDTALVPTSSLPFPEAGRTLRRFLIVRPDRMRHVTDGRTGNSGRLVGWEMTDGAGRKIALLPEQVVHGKLWNPYDDFRGLGEYEQAQIAAESDYLGANFKLNLAKNNGDQGVYIIAKSGIPDDAQRKQIVAQLREKRQMQQAGHFKPVFLTGDISIEDPKVRTVDAAFLLGQEQDAHRVYIAFGVPPSMADVVPSYSVGSASDYYRLIRDTCNQAGIHLCELAEAVTKRAMPAAAGGRLYYWLDWSEHPVMQEVRKEAADTATKYWDRGLPWKVVNDMLDLGMPQHEGWDVGYLPFSVAPVGSEPSDLADTPPAEDPTDPTDPSDPTEPDPEAELVQDMLRALRPPAPTARLRARDPKEVALWRQHMARRRAVAKVYQSRIGRELLKARAEVLAKLAAAGTKSAAPAPAVRAAAADFLFNLQTFKDGLIAGLRNITLTALQTAGDEMFAELGKDDPFSMPDPRAQAFLAERANKLSGVGDEVWGSVRRELQVGLDKGETMAQLADRVRAQFNDMARGRAERIAMTETGAAYGVARQEAMEAAGVQWKKWLSSGLDNVRPAHQLANGQIVRSDEPFAVGGEALDHPGDPAGSPGNVINCHCVSVAVAEGPEEGT